MIRRLVEQNYYTNIGSNDPQRIAFWLRELRRPELLSGIVQTHLAMAHFIAPNKPAIQTAFRGDLNAIAQALEEEEDAVRRQDRSYWEPSKRELKELRRKKRERRQG